MATRIQKNKPDGTADDQGFGTFVRWMWIAFGVVVLGVVLFFWILSKQNLPSFEELENPEIDLATNIYASGGELLGRYYIENRVPIPYEKLNPQLVNALLSTEDKRFYNHAGIDFLALGRVFIKTAILQQRSSGGGSTITQQLAKLLYTNRPARSLMERSLQKLKEWITAVRLERAYTKEEIIAMYLNEFDFINGAHGIQSAAETYFGKNQEDLSIQEAAVLVGMLKNPSLYRPDRFAENAKNRRNTVLGLMTQAGHISKVTRDSIMATDVDVSKFKRTSHIDGVAPYFRAELAKDIRAILQDKKYAKPDGSSYNIYRDGLKIYTTIDYTMQKIAEETMLKHMAQVQDRYFQEWKGMNPWTYEDGKIPVELKERAFDELVKTTERFQSMLQKRFEDQWSALEELNEGPIRGIDLDRLIDIHQGKTSVATLLANQVISRPMAKRYTDILKSSSWSEVMKDWSDFSQEVDKAFNTKRSMKVFAYNAQMEKDTIMTPYDSLRYHRMLLQTGILAIRPSDGHVKVWVGGVGHKYFKFDHIRTERQVGSTFKPFVYASAIFYKGISPCFKVEDIPYTITPGEGNFGLIKPWTPKNADGEYSHSSQTLFEALRKSTNTASVFLMKQLGDTNPVRGLVHNMGLDSSARRADGSYRLPAQPSIALGAADVTVMEMTGAYATFANNGIYVKPVYISRIENSDGQTIYSSTPHERIVLDPNRNYVMVKMLEHATSSAPGFTGVKSDYGGKTGTTNDHSDGWFMGITPDLVVGTWVGGEDRWIRFRAFSNGQGSRMARPFFSEFLKKIESTSGVDYDASKRFERPAEDLGIEIDCEVYERNNPNSIKENQAQQIIEQDFGDDFGDF